MSEIAIVGGGIAGLFCALKLSEQRHEVTIYESLDHVGGRIETVDLDGFKAECGPMRFEIDIEPMFEELTRSLGVRLDQFTPTSPGSSEYPKYELTDQEMSGRQLQEIANTKGPNISVTAASTFSHHTSTLDLLRYGIYRIFHPAASDQKLTLPEVVERRGSKFSLIENFAQGFGENFDDVRITDTLLNPVSGMKRFLYQLGFWNALDCVLSPGAVAKVRETGTFYHLLPENPSASEWCIFWLRLFRPNLELFTIKAGVYTLVEELLKKLDPNPLVKIEYGANVEEIRTLDASRLLLSVVRGPNRRTESPTGYDHVILAIPAQPLKNIKGLIPPRISGYIEGVIPFTLTKVFVVIDKPWWPQLPEVHTGAHLIPTREIHYFKAPDGSNKAMIMFYTDRPATAYWRPYVLGRHVGPQVAKTPPLRTDIVRQIARLLPTVGLSEADHLVRVSQSVTAFAIREWSHPPFGAASHAWAPGVDVVEALRELKAFGLEDAAPSVKNLHICGEAYSDYQGFIEGALRSASEVLKTIT
jgi:Flavin containing amine oxidoreductase